MHSLVSIHLAVNSCEKIKLNYYKVSGIYITKNKPLKSKLREINKSDKKVLIKAITSSEQLHNNDQNLIKHTRERKLNRRSS